ncbi:MAG: saccharopine dehydrogenase NADP-binding domain-containing protein [Acidobacteriota bacterium]
MTASDSQSSSSRRFDLVLFGATGFTGRLTARYLARHAPAGLRWAIAGRRREGLDEVVAELDGDVEDEIGSDGTRPDVLVADSADRASLDAMARATRVVATTVGPYARFGEPLVEACIAAGTHYADITGEPEFVGRLLERHDEAARAAGARIVSCCGFDSVPHDLGALLAVRQLPNDLPIRLDGFVRVRGGGISGGTWRSAVEAMAEPSKTLGAFKRLGSGERGACGGRSIRSGPRKIRREPLFGEWVAPLPTIDPWMVLRSACALEDYGPRFHYAHFVRVGSLPKLVAGASFVGGTATLARFGPTRRWLLSLHPSGEGPSERRRERTRFDVVFQGRAGDGDDGPRTVVEVSGGDPGYDETSKMLAESALCLVFDEDRLPDRAGILTPAMAFEERLIERLRAAGMGFDVVE